MVWWIFGIVMAIVLGYIIWTYNRLVSLSKRADAAWSDIDVQLKRRWDLVPALVETVKGYARHESSTLEHVVAARGQAVQAGSITDRGTSEQNLAAAVGRLFAIAEAYPDLKASQNFQGLHKSLVDIENKVQYARRYYNAVVRDWNTLVGTIPSLWVAGAAGYGERPYFQLDKSERAAPQVKLHLPRDLDDAHLDYDAWTGAYGARNKDFTKRRVNARTIAFETGALRPGESITIDVTMPSDAVARAAWMRELSWWLVDNFAYGLFPATLAACLAGWFFLGRDLSGRGAIVVSYEPPEGLGPAEAGTLLDERVNLRDISAVIIDLAVRGYLKIAEVGSKSLLSSGRDYRFNRLKGPDDLKPFEKDLYSQIFGGKESVLMSDLQTKFYPVIGRVKNDLYRGLSKEGYFDGNPDSVRMKFLFLGLTALAAALGLTALVQAWLAGRVFVFPIAVTGVLSAVVLAITSRVMPRKTHKGRVAWEQIAGLEEYIRRAEVNDIKAQDRRGIFERLLPYAIIFGLSNRWSKAFADLYTQPPDWYQPVDPTGYTTWMLMRDLDRSVSTMNTTFPSMPRATAASLAGPTGQGYSWSSGGFGGGSSGGGFGGGGGGSW